MPPPGGMHPDRSSNSGQEINNKLTYQQSKSIVSGDRLLSIDLTDPDLIAYVTILKAKPPEVNLEPGTDYLGGGWRLHGGRPVVFLCSGQF